MLNLLPQLIRWYFRGDNNANKFKLRIISAIKGTDPSVCGTEVLTVIWRQGFMRLGPFGTNRTVYNAKVSLFLRYSKGENRWSVQKLRFLYIMKTWLSNKGSITANAYCLISEQIILCQVRYSHFTQGCSRYLHSSWRYKKTDWNNTLQPQFFCDKSKYWSFLDRVTADTRSVHGAMKCICKLVWRGLKTNYFSLTSP